MALTHTVYFFFGNLDFVHDYAREHAPKATPVVTFFDAFAIEDARQLKMKLQEFAEAGSLSIIRIEKISFETQNVLLKVCEELTHTTVLFSFPPSVVLLDTLRSRGVVINQETEQFFFSKEIAEAFLVSTFSKRVSLFDKLAKEHSELDPKAVVRHLIEDLILVSGQKAPQSVTNGRIFLEALKLLEYQKSSAKQIFEYMALMVKK